MLTTKTNFGKSKKDFAKTNFVYLKEDTQISPEHLESIKGEMLRSIYNIKKDGKLTLDDMPYDTYILEAVESKNFLTTATIITFNKITEDKVSKKFIGLSPQTNGFLEIFVYSEDRSDESKLIPNATVIIERNTGDHFLGDNEMANKIQLKENENHEGRFESSLIPGEYIIEVIKNGYEKVKKIVKLEAGDNKVNIQLETQREHNFKVSVYNYDEKEFRVLENVQLKIFYGTNDYITEGITSKEGVFEYESLVRENFITIYANKPGYFPAQRTFVSLSEHKAKEDDAEGEEGTHEITIIMIKESTILNNDCIIMVNYCNIPTENFEQNFLFSDKSNNLLN
jgi:hypothetical protein